AYGGRALEPPVDGGVPAKSGVGVAVEVLEQALRYSQADADVRIVGAPEHGAAAPCLDRPARVEVPMKGRAVRRRRERGAHEIGDDDQVAVQREDAAEVLHRTVAVVPAVEVVEAGVRPPGTHSAV